MPNLRTKRKIFSNCDSPTCGYYKGYHTGEVPIIDGEMDYSHNSSFDVMYPSLFTYSEGFYDDESEVWRFQSPSEMEAEGMTESLHYDED